MEDFSLRQYCNSFSIKMACATCNKLVQPAEKMNLFSQADAIALSIRQCMLSHILREKEEFFLCDPCKSLISKCAEQIYLMELRAPLEPKGDIRCVWCENSNDLKEIFIDEQSITYNTLVGLVADDVNMPAWICNVCDDLLKDLDELHQSVFNATREKSNSSRPEKQVRRVVSDTAIASSSKLHSSEFDFPRERENEMEQKLISSEADNPCFTPHTPLHEEHFLLSVEFENESLKTADDEKSCTSAHVMELFDIQPEEILYAAPEWRTDELEESSGIYKVSSLPDDVDQQPKDEDKQVKCKESKQVHSSTECGSKSLNTVFGKSFNRTLTKQENVKTLFGCIVEEGNSETVPQGWTDDDVKSTKKIMEEKSSNHTGLTPPDKISKASKNVCEGAVNEFAENSSAELSLGALGLDTIEKMLAITPVREVVDKSALSSSATEGSSKTSEAKPHEDNQTDPSTKLSNETAEVAVASVTKTDETAHLSSSPKSAIKLNDNEFSDT